MEVTMSVFNKITLFLHSN